MKKFHLQLHLLVLLLLGGASLILSLIFLSPQLAIAIEPTPTPLAQDQVGADEGPSDTLCHLAATQDCTIVNELDLAVTGAGLSRRTYPLLGAQNVPTYTLVSATFDRPMNSDSLTPQTFFVTHGNTRLEGSITYLDPSQMAVFQPTLPLKPNTTYTATLSPEVRDVSGIPLAESWVWSFTTGSGLSPLSQGLAGAGLTIPGNMNVYFGDLHSHTSYSDGVGTPAQAFMTARANGADFLAVTEHGFMLVPSEWENLKNQANAATVNGQFVAIPGFEYTHLYGHLNVFGSDTFVNRNDPNYDTLPEFYNWLVNHPTALAQFNHPKDNPSVYDFNFNDFAFYPLADQKIVLQELETSDQFFLSLNKGWHLGTLKNRDTHVADWGISPWAGVVSPALTREAILDSLRARRTFFVSPSDSNLALVLSANGYWMGSAVPSTGSLNFTVMAYDPNPNGKPLRLNLYDNGVRVTGITLPSSSVYNWSPTLSGKLGHYYYAEAYQSGWLYPAYSSPIWVERPPLAEAGPSQLVGTGVTVKLDGRNSQDADGDALAYRWIQVSGPSISLNQANTAQPSFVAPATTGNVVLRLTVTDTGGLTASDETTISITTQPILAITKHAPPVAGSDGTVTYVLTVTNRGVTPANNVLIQDTLPRKATYVSGGTLNGNVVSWSGLTIPPNGGKVQVNFTVRASQSLVNFDYRATCANCIAAQGAVPVFTYSGELYLPLLH